MTAKKSSDHFTLIVGILIAGVVGWHVLGYLLPDQPVKISHTATTLLDSVMNHSGMQSAWEGIQQLEYEKMFELYREDSSVELSRNETHAYSLGNSNTYSIQWKTPGGDTFQLIKTDTAIVQTRNRVKDTTVTDAQLKNKLNASTFVIGLPYTLDDPNATLTYLGKTTFQETAAYGLQVQFQGSTDVWTHYYEEETLDWLGYWVKTSDHYSLVINDEMQTVNGFKLPKTRSSYRTDKQQNILYLRAKYVYRDFSIKP